MKHESFTLDSIVDKLKSNAVIRIYISAVLTNDAETLQIKEFKLDNIDDARLFLDSIDFSYCRALYGNKMGNTEAIDQPEGFRYNFKHFYVEVEVFNTYMYNSIMDKEIVK